MELCYLYLLLSIVLYYYLLSMCYLALLAFSNKPQIICRAVFAKPLEFHHHPILPLAALGSQCQAVALQRTLQCCLCPNLCLSPSVPSCPWSWCWCWEISTSPIAATASRPSSKSCWCLARSNTSCAQGTSAPRTPMTTSRPWLGMSMLSEGTLMR